MKKMILIVALLCLQVAAFAQFTPSVYAGVGTGTNLGGGVGIGTEMQYKFVSANAAVGCWWNKLPEHKGPQIQPGFDVGLKVYPLKWWFLGVNYGIMNEPLYIDDPSEGLHLQNSIGFSFTTGCRIRFYKGLYGMAYIGFTDSKKINQPTILGKQMSLPRFGFIVGWDFLKNTQNGQTKE